MSSMDVKVPDIGVEGEVEVIEICVSKGQAINEDDAIVVIESDKATVEVPSPGAGVVEDIKVAVGDKVKEGMSLISLSIEENAPQTAQEKPEIESGEVEVEAEQNDSNDDVENDVEQEGKARVERVPVPDLGGAKDVEVIEVQVAKGDLVEKDDTLIVLESDKATMEIPSPVSGHVKSVLVNLGDKLSEGDNIAEITTVDEPESRSETVVQKAADAVRQERKPEPGKPPQVKATEQSLSEEQVTNLNAKVHAGPAVRKLARELGADLTRVNGTGPRNRILKEDLHAYVKAQVQSAQTGSASVGGLPGIKLPDFSAYGEVEIRAMDKIQRVTAENMQASWLSIPHVTQFDEADITDMEIFRKQQKNEGDRRGIKLTPVAFLLKACAYVLDALPQFNVSIDLQNAQIIQKRFIHIGIAVDTPSGLVVPVVRNVNQKTLWELAEECQNLASKAKDKKLMPADMQGGCFTISSLGGIGGTAFTPIVNAPEVAILGVSKSQYKPVYKGGSFEPRLMLPLSLSYDHRAVNGADAARFTSLLSQVLNDLRRLLL